MDVQLFAAADLRRRQRGAESGVGPHRLRTAAGCPWETPIVRPRRPEFYRRILRPAFADDSTAALVSSRLRSPLVDRDGGPSGPDLGAYVEFGGYRPPEAFEDLVALP